MKRLSLALFLAAGSFAISQAFIDHTQIKLPSERTSGEVIDLNNSTEIIKKLRKSRSFRQQFNAEELRICDLLFKNLSDAELALKAEILDPALPAAVIFFKNDESWPALYAIVQELATQYKDTLRFVIIDDEELFKISNNTDVEEFPTCVLVADQNEVERIEPLSCESAKAEMIELFDTFLKTVK
jgi:hypothetical protein